MPPVHTTSTHKVHVVVDDDDSTMPYKIWHNALGYSFVSQTILHDVRCTLYSGRWLRAHDHKLPNIPWQVMCNARKRQPGSRWYKCTPTICGFGAFVGDTNPRIIIFGVHEIDGTPCAMCIAKWSRGGTFVTVAKKDRMAHDLCVKFARAFVSLFRILLLVWSCRISLFCTLFILFVLLADSSHGVFFFSFAWVAHRRHASKNGNSYMYKNISS